MDLVVIALYMLTMLGIGWYAKRRATSEEDFLVAGRRLGPLLYAGTMAAVVLGGASTVGGVGLGYTYGISGMWLVFFIGLGVVLLSLTFAARINRLEVYTVSQMLELRYGQGASLLAGIVMCAYTLMISCTSTIAYGVIFATLFHLTKTEAIVLGGGVVVFYSVLGGMWSITLTDFVQFIVKTVGIFFILLPVLLSRVGGLDGLSAALPPKFFDFGNIGGQTIVTYFVIYFFGLVIGQDIWQRVFTAGSERVAKWAGFASGVYCLLYALAGALIGMCARVLLPGLESKDDVYPQIVSHTLAPGLAGLVIAAALAAIMSTSSGALIATATVAQEDIVGRLMKRRARDKGATLEQTELRKSRGYILGFGVAIIGIACALHDVVAALTLAYDILVGGLAVAVIGGFVWARGTIAGALASIIAGIVVTLGALVYYGDLYANAPVFEGLVASSIFFVVVSVLTKPTQQILGVEWERRIKQMRRTVRHETL